MGEEEEVFCRYNYDGIGVALTSGRLIVRSEEFERELPIEKVNSFYVYPKRTFLSKKYQIFVNIDNEEDIRLIETDSQNDAVNIKDDLNKNLEEHCKN
ncbi:MAG: hypothetical protein BTN85_1993 [Candidatus Methanohalarchaeum thermophilum]|uniref:Uncharacterized protein n=1 Tax=Methanohalarchaeum thermophilum TaxID=1903181 RepID=A0A1Q6DSM0_METT1|nr:MAG: hypothetical protein BTN85_1993 [Candidatus Methanohalarchaeum thermophilum]